MYGGRCPHLILIIVGNTANNVATPVNNACNILSRKRFCYLSSLQIKNPLDFPTIPNSSFLIPDYSNSSFVLPLLEAVCQLQQQLFGRETAQEQTYLHHQAGDDNQLAPERAVDRDPGALLR